MEMLVASPDMMATLRGVFAAKGLTVEITRPPTIEFTVTTADASPRPSPSAFGDAVKQLVGTGPGRGTQRGQFSADYAFRPIPAAWSPDGSRSSSPRRTLDQPRPTRATSARPLSRREREVMSCISAGARNREIAAALNMAEKTVKNHVNHIFAKLQVRSRVEAVLVWQESVATA